MDDSDVIPQEVTDPTNCLFRTKEYWLIIYLIACGYEIVNIECLLDKNQQSYLMWTFPQNAFQVEQSYNRGTEMPIDLHKIEDAAKLFKRNLQYYRIR